MAVLIWSHPNPAIPGGAYLANSASILTAATLSGELIFTTSSLVNQSPPWDRMIPYKGIHRAGPPRTVIPWAFFESLIFLTVWSSSSKVVGAFRPRSW